MKFNTIIVAAAGVAAIGGTAHSCTTLATSTIGIAIIKRVLLGGIKNGLAIFKNKDSFLSNYLIEQAMPSELKSINNTLMKIAPGLVAKEKEYIAQAAAYTVNISEPILINAVNNLNSNDVQRIMQGPSGTATQVLKEKSATQLAAAIMPKVDEKLNEFGMVKSLNMALQGNNMLGSLFGGTSKASSTTGISQLASEQLVNGLFFIIEHYEKQNSAQIKKAAGQ